jgi:hypothetical protein
MQRAVVAACSVGTPAASSEVCAFAIAEPTVKLRHLITTFL